jgi:multidrug transporter EmrE-like cation transporter
MASSTYLLSALFVLATASANVMQKVAVREWVGETILGRLARLASSGYLWGGMACWGVSLVAYMLILTRVPLNVATSIAAFNFVAVAMASRLFLAEPIPALRVVGFACIVVGISIVAFTQRGPA